jgi:SpoVK/Ycf46/Vps4 family AAA+-type ATPase
MLLLLRANYKVAICDMICTPKMYADFDARQMTSLLRPTTGILLFGPPGCGKSTMASAICKYMGVPMVHITPSLLLRKWVGDTSQLTKAIFTVAEKIQVSEVLAQRILSLLLLSL